MAGRPPKDITGKRYGRLVAVNLTGDRDKWRRALWLCRCDCGNEVTVAGTALRSGNTKSCGCLQVERRRDANCLPEGLASFHRLYREYERSARNKGYAFELTQEDLSFLTKMNCHYCGDEPAQTRSDSKFCNGAYVFNGIDRIDNSKGYTMDNVVACCATCNYMKRGLSVAEFLCHIKKIFNKEVKRGEVH